MIEMHHKTGCRTHNTACDGDCDCGETATREAMLEALCRIIENRIAVGEAALRSWQAALGGSTKLHDAAIDELVARKLIERRAGLLVAKRARVSS